MIEATKKTDLNPHEKIEIPEWAKRQETTPFRADLGPTSTGGKLPDLGTTVCHTGGISSVTYDKTSDVINIRDIDQSNH